MSNPERPRFSDIDAFGITHHRITSYNVCYTKLLRIEEVPPLNAGGGDQGIGCLERHADEANIDRNNFV